MEAADRERKIQGLENLKSRAMQMAEGGADSNEVRGFIDEGKKELAYEIPDEDAFKKAAKATLKYKKSKG